MSTNKTQIDLSKCKIGQRVRLRDGKTARLVNVEKPATDEQPYHIQHDDGGMYYYTINGSFFSYGLSSQEDIVEILPPEKAKKVKKRQPAKEPMVDQSQEMIREAIESAKRTIFLLKSLLKP